MTALADWMAALRACLGRRTTPDEIGSLFTADALYFTTPFREPWRRPARRSSKAGSTARTSPATGRSSGSHSSTPPELAIITGTTHVSRSAEVYSNLWALRFEDGLCREFTEWWMLHTSE